MCGIAGIIAPEGSIVERQRLLDMASAMRHRGPDAQGAWITRNTGLAHARLKIIDLSDAANQPFTDGHDALVYNGEIFNYASLRRELSNAFEFRTRSDTEVLFRALEHWGIEETLRRAHGQFAFGFYRASDNTLTLARDHAGICPLYTMRTPDGRLCFASEIKPLLMQSPSGLDAAGVVDYFAYRYNIQNTRTLFEGIRRFPPAHFETFDCATGRSKGAVRYWRLRFNPEKRSPGAMESEFKALMDSEISAQRVSDVPVGMYLSGGIDSGALLHGFARAGGDIRSYTLGFIGDNADCSRVDALSASYSFRPNMLEFSPSELDSIADTAYALEEPFGDLIIAANSALARHAAADVRVVLSGEGGDESFCGYDHQRAFMKMLGLHGNPLKRTALSIALGLSPARLIAMTQSYPGGFGTPELDRVRSVHASLSEPLEAYLRLVRLFDGRQLSALFSERFRSTAPSGPDSSALREIFGMEEPWQAVMRAEIEQLTLIVNLLKQDRLGMRYSLEGRVPLASRAVMEFAGTLSRDELFGHINKRLLLEYSGARVIKKKPFSMISTPAYSAKLGELMDRFASRDAIEECGVLDWAEVSRLRGSIARGGILGLKRAMCVTVFMAWWSAFNRELRPRW